MKKKGLFAALAVVIFLGVGYSVSAQTGLFDQAKTAKSSSDSDSSSHSGDKANQSSDAKNAGSSSKKAAEANMNPFKKSNKNSSTTQALDQTATFNFKGMNLPTSVTVKDLDGQNPIVSFTYLDGSSASFAAQVNEIPSKSIRIFAQSDNSVQTIDAQTQISLGQQQSGDASHAGLTNSNLYLFKNSNGGYSLATPNYAGNTEAGQEDVMVEAVQN
ncbi:hypothetical protein OZX65_06200 [Leuconostocaceae bacterium ESL0723]|nr:hypothetical protein OZX65_06200 [Leuconostocaceae bacterium ESL0723]